MIIIPGIAVREAGISLIEKISSIGEILTPFTSFASIRTPEYDRAATNSVRRHNDKMWRRYTHAHKTVDTARNLLGDDAHKSEGMLRGFLRSASKKYPPVQDPLWERRLEFKKVVDSHFKPGEVLHGARIETPAWRGVFRYAADSGRSPLIQTPRFFSPSTLHEIGHAIDQSTPGFDARTPLKGVPVEHGLTLKDELTASRRASDLLNRVYGQHRTGQTSGALRARRRLFDAAHAAGFDTYLHTPLEGTADQFAYPKGLGKPMTPKTYKLLTEKVLHNVRQFEPNEATVLANRSAPFRKRYPLPAGVAPMSDNDWLSLLLPEYHKKRLEAVKRLEEGGHSVSAAGRRAPTHPVTPFQRSMAADPAAPLPTPRELADRTRRAQKQLATNLSKLSPEERALVRKEMYKYLRRTDRVFGRDAHQGSVSALRRVLSKARRVLSKARKVLK